jgi:hypothetical protein
MNMPGKKGKKQHPIRQLVELILIIVFVAYVVPTVKHTLFPNQMTRLEKMLRRSSMEGYHLAIDRKSKSKIILTVYNGGRSVTTEIYRDVIRELEPSSDDSRVFFAHSINANAQEIAYLTRTLIEADVKLKRVRRLEVTVCGRLKDQHAGVTRYDGHEPIYECEVPVQQIICQASARKEAVP